MKENYTKMNMADSEYLKLVKPYQKDALAALRDFISIDSVYDEATKSKSTPFGKGVDKALDYIAKVGTKLGFKADRCDNYVTELTYGEGEKTLDIYAHADVVPVNLKNWTKDPFSLTIEDDNLYGRGTCDDKGPGIACLFATKALMDKGQLGGYKLRFLFGGNEENGSLCLEHYFKAMKKDYPTIGFSPDADYPLIYAEKSIYSYSASYPLSLKGVSPFTSGDALNIVIGDANCGIANPRLDVEGALNFYLRSHPLIKASYHDEILTFKGKPSHGSLPWMGVNAALYLLDFLGDLYSNQTLKSIFKFYLDGKGIAFNGNFTNKYFDCSSYNVGKVVYDGKKLTIYVNVRFPSDIDIKTVIDNAAKTTKAEIKSLGGSQGFVSDPNSDFVKILLNAYRKETNDEISMPLAIGGGTYARDSKNSIAFGSAFSKRDYRMHGDDEYFPLCDFYDNMQIYAHAIHDLSIYLRDGKVDLTK